MACTGETSAEAKLLYKHTLHMLHMLHHLLSSGRQKEAETMVHCVMFLGRVLPVGMQQLVAKRAAGLCTDTDLKVQSLPAALETSRLSLSCDWTPIITAYLGKHVISTLSVLLFGTSFLPTHPASACWQGSKNEQ